MLVGLQARNPLILIDIEGTLVETFTNRGAGTEIETLPKVRRHVGSRGHGGERRNTF